MRWEATTTELGAHADDFGDYCCNTGFYMLSNIIEQRICGDGVCTGTRQRVLECFCKAHLATRACVRLRRLICLCRTRCHLGTDAKKSHIVGRNDRADASSNWCQRLPRPEVNCARRPTRTDGLEGALHLHGRVVPVEQQAHNVTVAEWTCPDFSSVDNR